MTWDVYEIVSNRPLLIDTNDCPFCGSDLQKCQIATGQTLLGGRPGVNHVSEYVTCGDCSMQFARENKNGNTWYVQAVENRGRVLLRGVPSCYERHIYKCNCGGDVTSSDKGGGSYKIPYEPYPRYEFKCAACDAHVLSKFDRDPKAKTISSSAPMR